MPTSAPGPASPVVVRAASAERLAFPDGSTMTLLADSTATGGALSIHRTTLPDGADGAGPHHHTAVSEILCVLGGTVQVLVGTKVLAIGEGDLAVVPAGVTHAFAAAHGHDAELLVAAIPGIERFELFRRIERVLSGREQPGTLPDDQSPYDNHPDISESWERRLGIAG